MSSSLNLSCIIITVKSQGYASVFLKDKSPKIFEQPRRSFNTHNVKNKKIFNQIPKLQLFQQLYAYVAKDDISPSSFCMYVDKYTVTYQNKVVVFFIQMFRIVFDISVNTFKTTVSVIKQPFGFFTDEETDLHERLKLQQGS